ncbi:14390_t:CDS:2, partial [Racocetra fulgida]
KKRTNISDESLEKDIKRKPIKARRNSRNELAVSLRERSPVSLYEQTIETDFTLMIPGFDPGMFGMSGESAIMINRPIEISRLLERGLYGDQTQNAREALPALSQVFSHACVTQAPGENGKLHSSFFSLMSCYIPEVYKKYLSDRSKVNVNDVTDTVDDSKSLPPGWVEINYPEYRPPSQEQYSDGRAELRILAIDCEMCITADGPALTRVSVVDDKLKVLYDSFSGITEEILHDVTVTIKDVQTQISELVDKNTVLVGHSLECDLKALRFAHPFIIDTSILYSDPRNSYKPKLKNLAKMWLDRNIQSKGPRGHDSIEDAMTCMDLLKIKLNRGLDFDKTHESIFERIYRMTGSTTAVVDREAKADLYVDGAKKVLDALIEIVSNDQNILYNLVFGRFLDLKTLPDDMDGRISLVKRLGERINKIYDKLPVKTMFIVTSEQFSDWTEHDEQELQNAYLKAK